MTISSWPFNRIHFYLLLVVFCGLLPGCALPPLQDRTVTFALDEPLSESTPLGKAFAGHIQQNPEKSGIYTLQDPLEAFVSRMALTKAAERTLDIQYYIWHGDTTGLLLLDELRRAADRGVRVRLLLDDNGISGMDDLLSALDSHPNIEVRLFNPFVIRKPKWLGYLTDFSRLNRRMHNKTFTADNQVTIAGGRNVGDEYFGATDEMLFSDVDILGVGPVVKNVSSDFDKYWRSDSSYPVDMILKRVQLQELDEIDKSVSLRETDPAASRYVKGVRDSAFLDSLLKGTLDLQWSVTSMISDDAAKGLGEVANEDMLVVKMQEIIGQPKERLNLVSAYFVPTADGVEAFAYMVKQGIQVNVLTNSLEATDVVAVHSGYAKSRKDLLKAGVGLYEMKSLPATQELLKRKRPKSLLGSSGSSLHSKIFSVDGTRVFIGSFNFDPRSVNLNTELGFVIENSNLAKQVDLAFENRVPSMAYQVKLDDDDTLVWIEKEGEKEIRYKNEPKTSFWRRSAVFLFSLMPIEGLL